MIVTLVKITKSPSPLFLDLKKLHDEGLFERFSPWLYCVWRTTEPHLRRAVPSAHVKVQTSDETCEVVCVVKPHTSKFLLPSLSIADLNFCLFPSQLFGFSSFLIYRPIGSTKQCSKINQPTLGGVRVVYLSPFLVHIRQHLLSRRKGVPKVDLLSTGGGEKSLLYKERVLKRYEKISYTLNFTINIWTTCPRPLEPPCSL